MWISGWCCCAAANPAVDAAVAAAVAAGDRDLHKIHPNYTWYGLMNQKISLLTPASLLPLSSGTTPSRRRSGDSDPPPPSLC